MNRKKIITTPIVERLLKRLAGARAKKQVFLLKYQTPFSDLKNREYLLPQQNPLLRIKKELKPRTAWFAGRSSPIMRNRWTLPAIIAEN